MGARVREEAKRAPLSALPDHIAQYCSQRLLIKNGDPNDVPQGVPGGNRKGAAKRFVLHRAATVRDADEFDDRTHVFPRAETEQELGITVIMEKWIVSQSVINPAFDSNEREKTG